MNEKNNKMNEKNNKMNETHNLDKRKYKFFPKDKEQLKQIIKQQIKQYGNNVNLNNVDTSNITDMSYLFQDSKFNGNISD